VCGGGFYHSHLDGFSVSSSIGNSPSGARWCSARLVYECVCVFSQMLMWKSGQNNVALMFQCKCTYDKFSNIEVCIPNR